MSAHDHTGPQGSIGDRIRGARVAANMSQAQLAKRLNTTQATVARWETGALFEKCRRELERIAAVTGTTAEQLFGGQ